MYAASVFEDYVDLTVRTLRGEQEMQLEYDAVRQRIVLTHTMLMIVLVSCSQQ